MKVSDADKKKVKSMGCLFNRESEDEFNVRVITKNGTMSSEELKCVSEAAGKYGSGRVAFTTRLTVEIVGVKYDNIPALQEFLRESGLTCGGTGARIRPVAACKGTTCIFGQIDTQAVAARIHDRFYEGYKDVAFPHKFKIAVGGCPNNCMKPDLNDFGLIGQNRPRINPELCHGCRKCIVAEGCQRNAPRLAEGKITIDREKCNSCGKCIRNCYFKCLDSEAHGVKIVIGGRWGRERRVADELPGIYTVEEAMDILEKALLCFRKYGHQKERFGLLVERMGFEKIKDMLLSDELLQEKEAILVQEIQA